MAEQTPFFPPKPLVTLDSFYSIFSSLSQLSLNSQPSSNLLYPVHFLRNVRLLDCTWNLQSQEIAAQQYQSEHIPMASWFDIDDIADKTTSLPHMLPSEERFIEAMKSFNITNESIIFLYDRSVPSAARVWWTFKVFGHDQVYIINGGLTQWKAKGYPVVSSETKEDFHNLFQTDGDFKIRQRSKMVYNYRQIIRNVVEKKDTPGRPLLLDARSWERFSGAAPEPRPGIPSGHIPGAINLPFAKLLDMSTGLYHPAEKMELEIQQCLNQNKKSDSIILCCGSGITACILEVALAECGYLNTLHYPYSRNAQKSRTRHEFYEIAVYDGSWTEFAPKYKEPQPTPSCFAFVDCWPFLSKKSAYASVE